ncbi:tol-pal system-associated acyl-CoA thioesterase [Polycladidibacter stylochi]|uniref:tol-pal system-associated acyl-CoA thioesterase n=1 Tax=Polycladidibacter stylochi TaxID=1807766 RepID=UPI000835324C|nr:tol-pal system-associated acyl-CoA thioesterase [Pseudovibrio stylochi]
MSDIKEFECNKTQNIGGGFEGKIHKLPIRVYYEDTDFTGIVYHAAFLRFIERGRTEFLRLSGVHHHELDAGVHGEKLAFAVRHMDINYISPAKIDDLLEVHTSMTLLKGARIVMEQCIKRQDTTLFTAVVTIAVINEDARPRRLPAELVALLPEVHSQF